MKIIYSYTFLRNNLASIIDMLLKKASYCTITRKGYGNVVMMSEEYFESIKKKNNS